jgi:hypothetical protein
MSSCQDCDQQIDHRGIDHLGIDLGIDHCHGTLVVHSDRTAECTDAACELADPLRHALIIDCAAVLGGCCAGEENTDLALAS